MEPRIEYPNIRELGVEDEPEIYRTHTFVSTVYYQPVLIEWEDEPWAGSKSSCGHRIVAALQSSRRTGSTTSNGSVFALAPESAQFRLISVLKRPSYMPSGRMSRGCPSACRACSRGTQS